MDLHQFIQQPISINNKRVGVKKVEPPPLRKVNLPMSMDSGMSAFIQKPIGVEIPRKINLPMSMKIQQPLYEEW